jgi:hypothetical protein
LGEGGSERKRGGRLQKLYLFLNCPRVEEAPSVGRMNRIFRCAAVITALFAAVPARAEPAPMTADRWEAVGAFEFAQKDGRTAVRLGPAEGAPLKTGAVELKGVDFATGTIEFDVLLGGGRDFAGVSWRSDAAGNGEYFYFRPHWNGRPDSAQYTPVVNGSTAWQIFPEGNRERTFALGKWMHVRLDVYASSAVVTVDGLEPMVIPHLKGSTRTGTIGLNAVAGAWFANVEVTPIAGYADPRPAAPEPALPAGSVPRWQVSPAMAEAHALARAGKRDWAGVAWVQVASESNGVANLSKAGPDAEGTNTYIARFTLRSAAAGEAAMRFGFSDSVQLFVNGRRLYAGSDTQNSRDYRFLGIVGFWDTLYLPLVKGANEVAFVVTDGTNGGTAAAARFEGLDGVTID